MQRVVVTGRGVVSAIGRGMAEFSRALGEGRSGIGRLSDTPHRVGAPVREFDPGREFDATKLALLDRSTQFALVAAGDAIAESGLDRELGPRAAVVVGTGAGSLSSLEQSYAQFHADREKRLHPFTVPRVMPNAAAGQISLAHGVTGPAFMVATACASSAYAVSLGMQMIRSGAVDVAVVGGTEACLVEGNLKAWEALRVLAPDTCRPFSRDRRGLVLGEGAGMMVLESLDHARRRDATVHGEIVGSSLNSDAHHILIPSLDGQAAAIRGCLADAGIAADDIGYVNAHGTATAANDVTETRALHQVFGAAAYRLAVSSTKAMHGHTLGAGGAIELLATLVGLAGRFAPPTMNYTEPDPECDLNYVPNEAQDLHCGVALTNSFAFGGHNAVLAVRGAHWV